MGVRGPAGAPGADGGKVRFLAALNCSFELTCGFAQLK